VLSVCTDFRRVPLSLIVTLLTSLIATPTAIHSLRSTSTFFPPRSKRMARTHERSSSPSPTDSLLKKLKTVHTTDPDWPTPVAHFAEGLFDAGNIQKLHTTYADSEPFKHATVENLFRDELLRNVKDECLNQLSFTEKETDIYKVCASQSIFQKKYHKFKPATVRAGSPNRRSSVPLLLISSPSLPPPLSSYSP
jgi:hypothetical protein